MLNLLTLSGVDDILHTFNMQQRWQLGQLILLDDPSRVHPDNSQGLVHGYQAQVSINAIGLPVDLWYLQLL